MSLHNGSIVGNAFKSISLRIATFKDENGQVIPKLKEDLEDLGIQMTDTAGQIRSTFDILYDLSKIFKDLDKNTQLNLTEKLGGKMQANIVASTLQNKDRLQELYEIAQNSAGSADAEFKKYTESISYSLDQLREQIESTYRTLIDDKSFKEFVQSATSVVGAIQWIIEKFGSLGTTVTTISFLILSFNEKWKNFITTSKAMKFLNFTPGEDGVGKPGLIQKWTADLRNYIKEWNKSKTAAIAAGQGHTILSAKIMGANAATKALKLSTHLLQGALTMLTSIGIALAFTAVAKLINRMSELKNKMEELSSSVQQNLRQNNDMITYLQKEGSEYDELSKKTKLTAEEQEKLAQIKQKIANSFPELITGYNEETGEIELQSKSTAELIELLKEKNQLENTKLIAGGSDAVKVATNDLKKYAKEYTSIQEEINKINSGKVVGSRGGYYKDPNNINDLEAKIATLKSEGKETIELEEKLNKLYEQRAQKFAEQQVLQSKQKDIMAALDPYINAAINNFDKLDESQKKVVQNMVKFTQEDLLNGVDYANIMAKVREVVGKVESTPEASTISLYTKLEEPKAEDYSNYFRDIQNIAKQTSSRPIEIAQTFKIDTKGIDDYIKDLKDKLQKASGKAKKDLESKLDFYQALQVDIKVDGAEDVKNANNKLNEFNSIQAEVLEAISKTKSEMRDLNTVLDQHAESGKWNNEILERLIEKYPDLLKAYGDDEAMTKALTDLKSELNNKAFERVDTEIEVVQQVLNAYGVDVENYATAEEAKTKIAQTEAAKRLAILKNEMAPIENEMDKLIAKSKTKAGLTKSEKIRLDNLGRGAMWKGHAIGEAQAKIWAIESDVDKFFDLNALKAKAAGLYSGIGDKDYNGKPGKTSKGSSKSDVKDLELKTDKYMALRDAIELLNNSIEKNKLTQESANNREKVKLLNEEIKLLDSKKKKVDELLKKQTQEKNTEYKKLSSNGFKFNANGILTNYEARLKQLQNQANRLSGESKEKAINKVKDLENSVKRYSELLSNDILATNKEILSITNEIAENRYEIIKLDIEHKEESTRNLDMQKQTYNKELEMLQYNKNSKFEDEVRIRNEINQITEEEIKSTTDIINYLNTKLKLYKVGTNKWNELNDKVNEYKNKLHDANKELIEHNEKIKEITLNQIDKILEKQFYNGQSQEKYEEIARGKINAIQDEINALRERWAYEAEIEERSKRRNEIEEIRNKIHYLQNDNVKQLTESQVKQLGLDKEREKILEHQTELQELQLKLQNIKNQKNQQQYVKKADGTFDFDYVADKKAIDDLEKQIKDKEENFNKWREDSLDNLQKSLEDKIKDFSRWERDNQREQQIKLLERQIKYEEDNMQIRREALEKVKKDIRDNYDSENPESIISLIEEGMTDVNNLYNKKFSSILDTVKDAVSKAKSELVSMQSILKEVIETQRAIAQANSSASSLSSISSNQSRKLQAFDTGGMTIGNGLAVLHDKEIVLNKDDTKNLLNIIEKSRNMVGLMNGYSPNVIAANSTKNNNSNIMNFKNITLQLPNVNNDTGVNKLVNSLKELGNLSLIKS